MNRIVKSLSLLVIPFLFAGTSYAGVDFIIDWGTNGKASEPNYNAGTHHSTAGNVLTVRGIIIGFANNGPFAALNGNGNEYTVVLGNMTSLGSIHAFPLNLTSYSGGEFWVYEDDGSGAAADFANAGSFSDGTLILHGPLSDVATNIVDLGAGCPGGTFFANWLATDGSLFGLVPGCAGDIDATWSDNGCTAVIPAGYDFHCNGHYGLGECPPTATEESSWGGVKNLFR